MSRNWTFGNISHQDRLDLEKYTKFLALKTTQAVVQSRIGDKRKSRCNPSPSSHDWFNIAIEDHPDIHDQARKVFGGHIPLIDYPVCVEILLETSEGDYLVLEAWAMSLQEQHCDATISVASVYYRMTLLLKSVIAVSRVTPAYKLSCRQSSDSYVLMYNLYLSPPQYRNLGEGYQEYKIGEVITPIGSIAMSVAYRTEMTITSQKPEKDDSTFMVKSNYFETDMSPKRPRPGSHGFHVDFNFLDEFVPPPLKDDLPNGVIPTGLVNVCNGKRPVPQNHISDNDKMPRRCENSEEVRKNSMNCRPSPDECKKTGAFAPFSKVADPTSFPDLLLPDTPFLKFFGSNSNGCVQQRHPQQDSSQNSDKNANLNFVAACDRNGSVNNVDRVDYNCNANEGGCKSGCSDGSDSGDFVMVDLRPPFADSDSNTDLGAFFRECQCAPPLASFARQPTLEEQVSDITSQLAKFETSMHDFDSFVDSICQVGDQK